MVDAIEGSPPGVGWSLGRIPIWVNILVLVLVLGTGGWFLWDQWLGGTPAADKPVDIGAINYGRPMRRPPMAQPDFSREGIFAVGPNMYRIHGGDYFMTLMPTETALAPLRLYYDKQGLVPSDVYGVLMQARQVTQNPMLAKSKNLSADQVKQLSQVMQLAGTGLILSDADKGTLSADWKAWNDAQDAAGKSAAQDKLLAAVKDVGGRSLQPTRDAWTAKGAEVKKILGK
jgi:hypothetical protein